MSAALASLEQLLSLSEAMLLSANSDDWTTLAKQQREREALTAALPENWQGSLLPAEQSQARQLLQNCQRVDATIGPCVESRLAELRDLLRF